MPTDNHRGQSNFNLKMFLWWKAAIKCSRKWDKPKIKIPQFGISCRQIKLISELLIWTDWITNKFINGKHFSYLLCSKFTISILSELNSATFNKSIECLFCDRHWGNSEQKRKIVSVFMEFIIWWGVRQTEQISNVYYTRQWHRLSLRRKEHCRKGVQTLG